ncbi:PREDICTED: NF-X1-type zinc finger protein NFXL1-like [Acropora digitifera]|uniref:NF-X1-type zinc finger protein NFXL1-like n=1 Tax=Acropora digitifera TaxID=70779 RepID=UPI00077B0FB6|nr:PREDICTED: NF-X1-type zinc finger protein NFXL1-like [Acropora digitifera]
MHDILHLYQVWSCSQCYTVLHLLCIQKWARDGAALAQLSSQEDLSPSDLPWFCPKCRFGFKQSDCPTRYYCYCEKQENPSFDPWLTPHSCGQSCSKPLKPDCGHYSILNLRTNSHSTQFAGDCLPCPKESVQNCLCGKFQSKRSCANPEWQCEKVCGKVLSCGHHTCEQVCHAGNCGDCPRAGNRKCPCGQTSVSLPCTEDIPTCGSTCDKLLACNRHYCTQRCHTGSCGTCRQMIKKKCRCGKREKDVVCSQDFLCEIKCQKMRQCERHQCRRKCCNGHCLPCEQICNRHLNCRNHKCPSQCHRGNNEESSTWCLQTSINGLASLSNSKSKTAKFVALPCPPCIIPVEMSCFGQHEISPLPCHKAKVFSCARPCGRQLACGTHTCQIECHTVVNAKNEQEAGTNCQVCNEPCSKPRPKGCTHACPFPCHKGDCPSCKEIVQLKCHCKLMTVFVNCSDLTSDNEQMCNELRSCKNQCPKKLAGCGHRCTSICHPGPCPSSDKCTKKISVRCPCQRRKKDFPCHAVQKGEGTLVCDKDCDDSKAKQNKKISVEEEKRKQKELKAQQEELERFERRQKGRQRKPRKNVEEIVEPYWFQRHMLAILMLSGGIALVAGLFFIALD